MKVFNLGLKNHVDHIEVKLKPPKCYERCECFKRPMS